MPYEPFLLGVSNLLRLSRPQQFWWGVALARSILVIQHCLSQGELRKSWPPKTPETPENSKLTRKWLKSGFWGLPQSNPKSNFLTREVDSNVTFSGQKVTFGVTFRVALAETPKVTF